MNKLERKSAAHALQLVISALANVHSARTIARGMTPKKDTRTQIDSALGNAAERLTLAVDWLQCMSDQL